LRTNGELRIFFTVLPRARERLAEQNFAGTANGGCFLYWRSPEDVFEAMGHHVRHFVMEMIDEDPEGWPNKEYSFTATHSSDVGWAKSMKIEEAEERGYLIEPTAREVKRGCWVRFVSDREPAPLTKDVTFSFRLERAREPGAVNCVFELIQPGLDPGEMRGDITEREGLVFVHRSAIGE
jgi:hypothetical protein